MYCISQSRPVHTFYKVDKRRNMALVPSVTFNTKNYNSHPEIPEFIAALTHINLALELIEEEFENATLLNYTSVLRRNVERLTNVFIQIMVEE